MDSALTFTRSQLETAHVAWAASQTGSCGVRTPYVDWWLAQSAGQMRDGQVGRAVIEYDAAHRLLSLDVWCGENRVYGMDDFV
jgi:hypothetical protein